MENDDWIKCTPRSMKIIGKRLQRKFSLDNQFFGVECFGTLLDFSALRIYPFLCISLSLTIALTHLLFFSVSLASTNTHIHSSVMTEKRKTQQIAYMFSSDAYTIHIQSFTHNSKRLVSVFQARFAFHFPYIRLIFSTWYDVCGHIAMNFHRLNDKHIFALTHLFAHY